MIDLNIIRVDYHDPVQAADLIGLLDAYARDPMGGGKPLAPRVRRDLVAELATRPQVFSLLAYVGEEPVGLVNCLESFSTFSCQPIINIHDFMIVKHWRGRGLSQPLLERVEGIARAAGCCKLTLEVLGGNHAARVAYRRFGFSNYQLDPSAGQAEFWHKPLE